jgi:hypothetical protein
MGGDGDATQIPEPPNRRGRCAPAGDRGIRGRQRSCVLKVAFGQCQSTGPSVGRSYSHSQLRFALCQSERANERAVVWHQDEGPHRHSHTHKSISHRSAGDWLSARVRERETRLSISIFLDACARDLLASEDEFYFRKVPLILSTSSRFLIYSIGESA